MLRNKLKNSIQDLDKKVEELSTLLEAYSSEQLLKKPNEGSWSALQLVQHLMIAEKQSLAYCKKKLSFSPKLKKAGLRATINSKIVTLGMVSPFKFKAPNGAERFI